MLPHRGTFRFALLFGASRRQAVLALGRASFPPPASGAPHGERNRNIPWNMIGGQWGGPPRPPPPPFRQWGTPGGKGSGGAPQSRRLPPLEPPGIFLGPPVFQRLTWGRGNPSPPPGQTLGEGPIRRSYWPWAPSKGNAHG